MSKAPAPAPASLGGGSPGGSRRGGSINGGGSERGGSSRASSRLSESGDAQISAFGISKLRTGPQAPKLPARRNADEAARNAATGPQAPELRPKSLIAPPVGSTFSAQSRMGVGKAPLPPGKAGLFADDNLRKEQRRKAGGHDINRKPELPPLSQFQSKSRDMSAKDSMGAMNESRKMLPGEENNPNGPDFAAREMRFKGRKAPRMQDSDDDSDEEDESKKRKPAPRSCFGFFLFVLFALLPTAIIFGIMSGLSWLSKQGQEEPEPEAASNSTLLSFFAGEAHGPATYGYSGGYYPMR